MLDHLDNVPVLWATIHPENGRMLIDADEAFIRRWAYPGGEPFAIDVPGLLLVIRLAQEQVDALQAMDDAVGVDAYTAARERYECATHNLRIALKEAANA